MQTRSLSKLLKEINIQDLFYEIYGEKNKKTITLIHGLTSAGQTWLPIIQQLSKTFKVLVYDQRGHGNSTEAGYNYSLDSMADDLYRLLNLKKIKKTHILGHSFGGRTAMRFTEKYPSYVQSLIIEDMTFKKIGADDFENVKKIADKMIKVFNPTQLYQNEQELKDKMKKFYTKLEIIEFMERKTVKMDNGKIQLMFKPHVRELYNYYSRIDDFSKLLKNSKLPILILRASTSSDIPVDEIIEKQKSNIIMKTIKNSQHNIHGSQTKAFLNELEEFFKSLK